MRIENIPDYLQKIDTQALEWMRSLINTDNAFIVTSIQYMADMEIIPMFMLILGLWAWGIYRKKDEYKKKALLLIYCISIDYALYWCLSLFVFSRTRPELVSAIAPLIQHIPDNSFPSGHAVFAGASIVGLYLIGNRLLLSIFSILFTAMLLSRIFAGIHYPGDIIAGVIIGAGFAGGLSLLRNKKWFEIYAIQLPIKIASYAKL